MRYAETGFNLEIDLTRGNIERVQTDPRLTELHLGGLGTNARMIWDRVPPETEPFSPDNLLIFPGNHLRLTDFGIAKVAQKTIQGSGTGTVGYMAPEQALGRPSLRSDVCVTAS